MAVYAWADLHGRLDIFNEGLKYLNPEDKIYFLGDAADRGPNGWEIIKDILYDLRFTYIKGNHEDLMVKAIGNFKSSYDDWYWDRNIELWYWNGGKVTHDAFAYDESITDEEKIEILNQLKALPFVCVYHNAKGQDVLLSHAGCDNFETAETWDEEKFIWDRNHLMFYDAWYGEDNERIIHGHTPIELMIKDQQKNAIKYHDIEPDPWTDKGAYWYGQGHKCNIDTGAVWNSHSVLLNLDTWEETIINLQ